jgi:hypothetical protein
MLKDLMTLMVLSLCITVVSAAHATVIDVIPYDIGCSGGRLGGIDDPLQSGDEIGIKLVLNNNPYPGYPSYDGYLSHQWTWGSMSPAPPL